MIVYVETNFILEIVREQEDASAANRLLNLAENGDIGQLRCPAHAVSEAVSNIGYQRLERSRDMNSILEHQKQLRRSPEHAVTIEQMEGLVEAFRAISRGEQDRTVSLIGRLLQLGELLPTTAWNYQ